MSCPSHVECWKFLRRLNRWDGRGWNERSFVAQPAWDTKEREVRAIRGCHHIIHWSDSQTETNIDFDCPSATSIYGGRMKVGQ